MKITLGLLFIGFFFACGSDSVKTYDAYAATIKFELHDLSESIRLPENWKKSSKYRLKEDMPDFAANRSSFESLLSVLELSEFKDDKPDVFVDTSASFRIVVIHDFSKMPLDKKAGAYIKTMLNDNFRRMADADSDLTIQEITSTIKSSQGSTLLRYKHLALRQGDNKETGYYMNNYFYTTRSRTFQIVELNELEEDISNYIWSIRS